MPDATDAPTSGPAPRVPAFRGLLLDLDGTLADTMPSHYIAWCRALEPFGLTYDEQLFYDWGGRPDTKIAEDLAREQGVNVEPLVVAEAKRAAYMDLGPAHVRAIPATKALAEACRGVVPIAIATGGRRDVARAIVDTLGISDWFDAMVTADDVTEHKPAPETYLKAARAIGIDPGRCLAVEDTKTGLTAARAAGCTVIHVDDLPADPRKLLSNPASVLG